MSRVPVPVEDRFWDHVEKTDSCWLWTGAVGASRYGVVGIERPRTDYAHRVAYRLEHGTIPPGFQIDHLCRVRLCVRPDHLEAVTQAENISRQRFHNSQKTHCPSGHPYEGDNLVISHRRDGRRMRQCRACIRGRAS